MFKNLSPTKLLGGGEKQPLLLQHRRQQQPRSEEHVLSPHDSARFWDVKMPPIKADMVSGKLIPTIGTVVTPRLRMKQSRVTLEIHSDADDDTNKKKKKKQEETVVVEGLLRGKSMKQVKTKELGDEEFMVMRIFRPTKKGGGFFGTKDTDKKKDDDEESVDSIEKLSGVDKEFADGKWTEAYIYNLDGIEVLKRHRQTVEMQLGQGNDTKVRDLVFTNEDEATTFCDILESLGKLEAGRAKRRLESYLSKHEEMKDIGTNVQLLVDIVSAVKLPVADLLSTDAYVSVHLGRQEVHRTAHLPNT
jgi:hypothetical protein